MSAITYSSVLWTHKLNQHIGFLADVLLLAKITVCMCMCVCVYHCVPLLVVGTFNRLQTLDIYVPLCVIVKFGMRFRLQ